MLTSRRAVAHSVPSFGRRARMFVTSDEQDASSGLTDDLRLFGLTFAAGFLFVSVYLA
jgi:hypothetical protein